MGRLGSSRRVRPRARSTRRVLTIDIGGTGLKAAVIDRTGKMLTDRVRVETPASASPSQLVDALVELVEPLRPFEKVSVGFPGVVRRGRIVTAPNLGDAELSGFDLAGALRRRLGRPVRVVNDAEIHGWAAITGTGLELVITLGTGFGTAVFEDGRPLSVLELAHHPLSGNSTYEELLGKHGLKKRGKKSWNRHLKRAIETLRALLHFDRLYIGGGNASKIGFDLDPDITIVSNRMGVRGGAALWERRPGSAASSDRRQ